MRNNNQCAILINSCDSYEDVWMPFFTLLKKYWPNCSLPIYLNTETKKYSMPGLNIKVINLEKKYQGKNIPWGKRLKLALKSIDTKYILFMLDDFLIFDYVNIKKIDEVINWMDNDSSIGVFSFFRVEDDIHKDTPSKKYPGFYLRNRKGEYRYNCQAAIWNRNFLISTLRNFESAWDWEVRGNVRSYRSKYKFYTLNNPNDYPIPYNCEINGIVRGKWRLPETKELLDKENIKIDYNIRNNKTIDKSTNFVKRIKKGIKFRINKVRSKI